MPAKPLHFHRREVFLKKARTEPDFTSKTVLVADPWEYVDLWLKRAKKEKARFYWSQSRAFFTAARQLPPTSSPLAAYYCFLNAAKALLQVKNVPHADSHGVAGATTPGKKPALTNEIVQFKNAGVLTELCRLFGETVNQDKYTLKDVFYNLPFIHRAYTLTYASEPELFIRIVEPRFVRKSKSDEAWFCARVSPKYATSHTEKKLPAGFERDRGVKDHFCVRRKKRFSWQHGSAHEAANLQALNAYHQGIRRHVVYVYGPSKLWYLKRSTDVLPGIGAKA